jgi:hypothetical protein
MRRSRRFALVAAFLSAIVALAACSGAPPTGDATGKAGELGVATVQATQAFDPSVGAPLPYNRIVAAYGIVGGVEFNGPASSLDTLTAFLPQLQQLGQQYAALDPAHPVKLAIDLVVNSIQPCSYFPRYCSSWACDTDAICASRGVGAGNSIEDYIKFCKDHGLLLFFDLQLGTEPVADAVTNHLLPYLKQYSFTEVALDTEFHFPDTPQGYAEAAGYPCCLGSMDASEVNWTINELAQISLQQQLPRKVVLVHQWNPAVLNDKDKIQRNPNVSLVLQSDGFGAVDNKLGDYQIFVQSDLLEYGGYKLFFQYSGGSAYDYPLQSPQDVMRLFPQPLFISYE